MKDTIERQAAIDAVHKEFDGCLVWDESGEITANAVEEILDNVPSAQPEPAIPISWIEEEIKRLESRKSSFAVLDAVQLKALIKRWESEQNETD